MARRLAAILAADVVGYSRLMGEDEAGTLAALKAHRDDFIDPTIAKHNGRLVKLMGDGALVEFASAVDAVECAAALQEGMTERNAEIAGPRRIIFRMGINIGDLIVEGDDLYGDGVNIAARLEGLAEPGGIYVSRNVVNQVKGKVEFGFEDQGEQSVKNIAEPVHAFRVLPEAQGDAQPLSRKRRVPALAAGFALSLMVVVGLVWWQASKPEVKPASVESMAFPLPAKPSIAVLPFVNLSGVEGHDYLADGITEDIINALSRFMDLFVIARTSTFAYKGKPVKVQRVAEDLGVRYVLEGSVRKSPDRLRVTARLVDALSGGQIWAESYDRKPDRILELQDDITQEIVARMAVKVDEAELERIGRKAPASLDAYDYVLRADITFNRYDKDDNLRARALYEKAIEYDPEYARAYTGLAGTHERDFVFGWSESPAKSLRLAIESAQKAIALDPSDYKARNELGWAFLFDRRHEEGMAELEKAITLNPNDPDVLTDLGLALIYVGKPFEALNMINTAMRLNPFHPEWYWDQLAFSYYYNGQYEEAIRSARRVSKPWAGIYRELAASYARLGRMKEAEEAAAKVLELEPEFATEIFRRSMPFKVPEDVNHYLDALHKAGLPKHPPLPLPDKPSIAVLPFNNMSDDASQEYFADGMTEDLITDLSKISGLFVIARNSSFAYKDQQVKVRQVAEELGVRYVLEGSVRRIGDQVRINTQLIDAMTGGHVWAERYDRKLDNIFVLQDAIIGRVVQALELHLTESEQWQREKGPQTDNLEAYDLVLRARRLMTRFDHKAANEARDLLQRAIELDPSYVEAHSLLGIYYFDEWRVWGLKRDQNLAHALELAATAVELDPSDPAPHVLLALVHQWRREFEAANAAADKALALELNDAITLSNLASMLNWAGRSEEALVAIQQAIRLDPFHPPNYLEWLAFAFEGVRDYDRCLEAAKRGVVLDPDFVGLYVDLASCYAALGKEKEARAAVAEILRTNPRFTLKAYASYAPFTNQEDLQRSVDRLRKAGVPE